MVWLMALFFRNMTPRHWVIGSWRFESSSTRCHIPEEESRKVYVPARNLVLLLLHFTYSAFIYFFPLWRCGPTRAMASSFLRFLNHTQRRIAVGRTPLDECSVRRRDFYLTTHNTHNRQTSMPPVGFKPTMSAGERPQTYAVDGAAMGTGLIYCYFYKIDVLKMKGWNSTTFLLLFKIEILLVMLFVIINK